jgi:hypothetical protein
VLARRARFSGRCIQDHVSPGRRAPEAFICQRREKIPSLQEDGAVGGEAGGNHYVSGRLESLPPAKSARREIIPSKIVLLSLAYILSVDKAKWAVSLPRLHPLMVFHRSTTETAPGHKGFNT